MVLLRSLGRLCLLIAFAAAAFDGMRMLATPKAGIQLASIADHLTAFGPETASQTGSLFSGVLPSMVWSGFIEPVLILPMTMVFAALGALLFLAGYKKPPPEPQLD